MLCIHSIKSLTVTGKMAYLIPFSIFRNRFAFDLRKQLLEKLCKIIDLSGRCFPEQNSWDSNNYM